MSFTNWFVPAPMERYYHTFGFYYPNLWNERMKDIIEAAISGGIIKNIFEKYTKSKWNLMPFDIESGQLILDFDDLIIGFQICLFAYYAALLIFLAEVIVSWIVKIFNNDHEFSDDTTSCSQSIYSLITEDASSVSSFPVRRDNAELDVSSVSSDSDRLMNARLSRLGLELDDISADGMTAESVASEDDDEAERNINENNQGIEIEIEDYD